MACASGTRCRSVIQDGVRGEESIRHGRLGAVYGNASNGEYTFGGKAQTRRARR